MRFEYCLAMVWQLSKKNSVTPYELGNYGINLYSERDLKRLYFGN